MYLYRDVRVLHQFDRAKHLHFQTSNNEQWNNEQSKKAYLPALFAFRGLYQAHAGRLQNYLPDVLIIGSHVTVGVPRERGMFGGVQ